MAKQRVRNEAAPEEVAKVCRAELVNGLEKKKYMRTDSSIIAENYLAFILALLDLTLRPTANLLAQAVKLAFKPEQGEAENFGYAIHGCVKFARNKVKSLASGAKLPSAIKAIAVKLKAKRAAPSRLNQSLRKRALQRHVSAETAASTVSSAPTVIKDFFGSAGNRDSKHGACDTPQYSESEHACKSGEWVEVDFLTHNPRGEDVAFHGLCERHSADNAEY